MVKFASHCFNGLLWAMSLSLFLISVDGVPPVVAGTVFWLVTLVFVVVQSFAYRKASGAIGPVGSFVSLASCFLCCLVFAGPDRLVSLPAEIVRSGLVFVDASAIGDVAIVAVLAAVLVALGAVILYDGVKNPRPYAYDPDPEKAKVERTGRIARWVAFAVLGAVLCICSCVPGLRAGMGHVVGLLSSGDIGAVVEYLRQFGPQAALVSGALMVLQSLAAPIPAFIITLSNAVLFGWWQGAILSWTSSMVGAAICFYIARVLGRDAVSHFMTGSALEATDKFFEKFGTHAILICRLLPFVSFDYVSYAAGLTSMGFWQFFIATGIGQLPATLVYSYVGGTLTGGAQALMTGLLVAFSAAILGVVVYRVFKSRNADLVEKGGDAADE